MPILLITVFYLFMTKRNIFGILYQNKFLMKKIRQNDLKRLSAFCQKAVFGNMSVHRLLINKLKRTGLNESGIKLMESYLKNRKQEKMAAIFF
jgi:hypothetical protein